MHLLHCNDYPSLKKGFPLPKTCPKLMFPKQSVLLAKSSACSAHNSQHRLLIIYYLYSRRQGFSSVVSLNSWMLLENRWCPRKLFFPKIQLFLLPKMFSWKKHSGVCFWERKILLNFQSSQFTRTCGENFWHLKLRRKGFLGQYLPFV